jgi:hypothetical protein
MKETKPCKFFIKKINNSIQDGKQKKEMMV